MLTLDEVLVLAYTCAAHRPQAQAVAKTWARRFPRVRFVTDDPAWRDHDPMFIPLTGRKNLARKSLAMWQRVAREHGDGFKWLVKVDDDCFLHAENLRAALAELDPDEPHYLGYVWKRPLARAPTRHRWVSGMCVVLSRGAFRELLRALATDPSRMGKFGRPEDVDLADALATRGVYASELPGAHIRKEWAHMTRADALELVVMTELSPKWLHFLSALYDHPRAAALMEGFLFAWRRLDVAHRRLGSALTRSPRLAGVYRQLVNRLR